MESTVASERPGAQSTDPKRADRAGERPVSGPRSEGRSEKREEPEPGASSTSAADGKPEPRSRRPSPEPRSAASDLAASEERGPKEDEQFVEIYPEPHAWDIPVEVAKVTLVVAAVGFGLLYFFG